LCWIIGVIVCVVTDAITIRVLPFSWIGREYICIVTNTVIIAILPFSWIGWEHICIVTNTVIIGILPFSWIGRECIKGINVSITVSVYFIGTLALVGDADPWLTVPILVWAAGYTAILVYFVPRLQRVSELQADARALMTGRVVDSYTNIQTIKLFAHTRREQDYARGAMDEFLATVRRQMRLVTKLTFFLHFINKPVIVMIFFGLFRQSFVH